MQTLLVLAALHVLSAAATKAAQTGGQRLVRAEAAVNADADVLLDSRALAASFIANCTMATVFGADSTGWPTTVAEAKSMHVAYCMGRGYSNATCTGVIDEHFVKHGLTQGSNGLSMTESFCQESVKLLELDAIHHWTNATFLLESISSPTLGGARGVLGGGRFACFPSSAVVSVQLPDGAVATRAMEDVRVGDLVHTGGGFSRVFAFMDHVSDTETEYVQLKTASGYELSLTADHIVYAHAEQTPVLAGTIIEGDLLWTASGVAADFVPSRVVQVQHGLERGMHAPLTEEGSVVVNGVLSSSYATVKSLRWGASVLVSGHAQARACHEPLRFACSLASRLCEREWHSAEGRHVWTQFILDKFGWLQAMNSEYSDIRSALVAEPSVFSWLASFALLGAAVLVQAMFGEASRVALLAVVVAVALAAARRKVRAKWD